MYPTEKGVIVMKRRLSILLVIGICILIMGNNAFAFSYSGISRWRYENVFVLVNSTTIPSWGFYPICAAGDTWNRVLPFFFLDGWNGWTTAGRNSSDGLNVIVAENLGPNEQFAYLRNVYYLSTGEIIDSDMVLNKYYPWSSTGAPGTADVQNVVTHEAGHMLMLNDLWGSSNTEKTMYGYVNPDGETKKRTLDYDDMLGMQYIYGP